ncbi:hypothetical protein E2562_007863 [Oryza meyeriana var. granulata]|uniref:Uncharacterized protein n=1 Tax=Oryza meyeriana var. granulata TaxID=110450 RepID=A0A6G1F579_9ORYZ|nr:hypothetical protein E2562_007863 [Oryza meyeriana var. granulata]
MVVAAVVAVKGAERQQEENLVFVLSMVGGRDAKNRIAQRVQRGNQAFASLMEVVVAVNTKAAQRVLRAALISAKLMGAERDAHI